jgi:hypothetical protein
MGSRPLNFDVADPVAEHERRQFVCKRGNVS